MIWLVQQIPKASLWVFAFLGMIAAVLHIDEKCSGLDNVTCFQQKIYPRLASAAQKQVKGTWLDEERWFGKPGGPCCSEDLTNKQQR